MAGRTLISLRVTMVATLVAVLLWAGWSGWTGPASISTVAAQERQIEADQLQLVRLTADPQASPEMAGSIRFQAVVNYRLQTAPAGFLLLFIFEEDSPSATQNSTKGHPVVLGSGQAALEIPYQPRQGTDSLTVTVGLFRDDQTLLAWSSTTPMSLAPFPSRAAFAKAMAARLAGNYSQAVEHFSVALELAPQTGNYYYWRADTRLHLGQYDGAVFDYTRALELMPQDRASQVGRGVALLWREDWPSAIADLTRGIEQAAPPDRTTAWALRARGIAHAALSQPAAAIADYQAYLALVPNASDRAEVNGWMAQLQALRSSPG